MSAGLELTYFIVMFVFIMLGLFVIVRWEYLRARRDARKTNGAQIRLDGERGTATPPGRGGERL